MTLNLVLIENLKQIEAWYVYDDGLIKFDI